ncbi:hypothetical protein N2152v2_009673 [Parachlorella kessleri]
MGGQARAKQHVLNLPKEVLLQIFKAGYYDEDDELDSETGFDSLKHRVLEKLWLFGGLRTLQDSLAAVCLFPKLKILSLNCRFVSEARLDLAVLEPLSTLEHLHVGHWQSVDLKGTNLLPQLSYLKFFCVGSTVIDAALPSLLELKFDYTETLQLSGPQLHLPQLSQLSVDKVKHLSFGGATNDWSQPPPLSSVTQLTGLRCSPAIIPHLGPLAQLQQLEFGFFGTRATDITVDHCGWLCGLSSLRRLSFGRKLDRRDSATARLHQVRF